MEGSDDGRRRRTGRKPPQSERWLLNAKRPGPNPAWDRLLPGIEVPEACRARAPARRGGPIPGVDGLDATCRWPPRAPRRADVRALLSIWLAPRPGPEARRSGRRCVGGRRRSRPSRRSSLAQLVNRARGCTCWRSGERAGSSRRSRTPSPPGHRRAALEKVGQASRPEGRRPKNYAGVFCMHVRGQNLMARAFPIAGRNHHARRATGGVVCWG